MKNDYVKAVLYAYPALEKIGEAVGTSVENKALLSYKNPRSAEAIAGEIAREIAARDAISELHALVDQLLKSLSEEENYLLEYKYFRRKQALDAFRGYALDCSERSYFRKQQLLLEKAADFFGKKGWSRERFLSETNGIFSRVMSAIGGGMEYAVTSKRAKRGIKFHSS